MEYGFVGFCNKEDKVFYSLMKEWNNIDYLGLRRMNVRLSNLMFPFTNTLMPNLVYFYYLHALYYAVLYGEKNPEEERKVTKADIKKINDFEKEISQAIQKLDTKKGFLGDVKERAYGKYKNSMKRLHFFEANWIPTFNENQRIEWENKKKTLHEYLTETNRYKFVCKIVNANDEQRKEILNDEINNKSEWLYKLEEREKIDFIWRVIDPYGPEKGTITEYSVFSNIVMYYCELGNKPGEINDKFYRDDYKVKIYSDHTVEKFDKLFDKSIKIYEKITIEVGSKDRTYSEVNQFPVYQVAREYSKLQAIAKLAYNMCLFEKNMEKKEYKKELIERIEIYKNELIERKEKDKRKRDKSYINPDENGDYGRVFFDGNDENLRKAFKFIKEISNAILKNESIEESIEVIVELVKVQERNILGSNSRLDSGLAFEAMGNYEDTFRWEYRPEIELLEAMESEDKDAKSKKSENNQNMCAQYYIYELFIEKIEENKKE